MNTQEATQPEQPMTGQIAATGDDTMKLPTFERMVRPVRSVEVLRTVYHVEDGRIFEAKVGAILPVRGSKSAVAMFDQEVTFELLPDEAFRMLMSGLVAVAEYDAD